MRVTIDSSEPIDSVLRVVGALYGVSLSVGSDGASAPASTSRGRGRGRGRARAARTTQRTTTARRGRSGSRADASAVREWARSHGYAVSDRGRISGEILAAYRKR